MRFALALGVGAGFTARPDDDARTRRLLRDFGGALLALRGSRQGDDGGDQSGENGDDGAAHDSYQRSLAWRESGANRPALRVRRGAYSRLTWLVE